MQSARRSLSDSDVKGALIVFGLAALLGSAYIWLTNVLYAGPFVPDVPLNRTQWAMGFAFCLMPLSLAAIPGVLRITFFGAQERARQKARRGDLDGALQAYSQQLAILNRFPWLEALRGTIREGDDGRCGLREDVLLSMGHIAYEQRDYSRASHYLWRCLGHNPGNTEALVLLDVIRTMPHEGIVGW